MNADGSNQTQLLDNPRENFSFVTTPRWSPDGDMRGYKRRGAYTSPPRSANNLFAKSAAFR